MQLNERLATSRNYSPHNWGLLNTSLTQGKPGPVVRIVQLHHSPQLIQGPGFPTPFAVYGADILVAEQGGHILSGTGRFDIMSLTRLGLTDRPEVWRKLVLTGVSSVKSIEQTGVISSEHPDFGFSSPASAGTSSGQRSAAVPIFINESSC